MGSDEFVRSGPASSMDDVVASEAAAFAFCAKAWHLEYALRRPASAETVKRRTGGTVRHNRHGARVAELRRIRPRLVVWSVVFLTVAAVALVVGILAGRLHLAS